MVRADGSTEGTRRRRRGHCQRVDGYAVVVATVLPRWAYLVIGFLAHPLPSSIHRRLYTWTGGRGLVGGALGVDVILVETRGRRSGVPRVLPLGAVRDGATWVLTASNGGKERLPAWVHNLRADPIVTVDHEGGRSRHAAREVARDEYDRLWSLVTAAYPGYQVYRDRADRPIPLFVLDPVRDPVEPTP